MRVCSVHGCPEIYPSAEGSRCVRHRREADQARGTARDRGYATLGHQAFRRAVLARDPICVICHVAFSTVADHYPLSRRELADLRLDPNDPSRGRGLCKPCHDSETAQHQPGGWNSR
jgi:5-methylcytosine-specific restriction protein A